MVPHPHIRSNAGIFLYIKAAKHAKRMCPRQRKKYQPFDSNISAQLSRADEGKNARQLAGPLPSALFPQRRSCRWFQFSRHMACKTEQDAMQPR
jgi:hypothetical protein